MDDLSQEHFARYFNAVHGHAPFPWQQRLLVEVVSTGRWPPLLDIPTGAGKTATIDVAVFHLAIEATRPAAERRAPRRIIMVVDRRTVVDQAYERAQVIERALCNAKDGVLRLVRERLCSLTEGVPPLARAQLRGGMPRDNSWARTPDQPLVAVSTVDQVGSRLLFRGYGVSDAMRPIHAGLLGHDTLFLLDEVHLSQPFLETLEAIRHYRKWTTSPLPDRWQCVPMSATPGSETERFKLNDDDLSDERLARRLTAAKPTECVEVKVTGSEATRRERFADEVAKRVVPFAARGRAVGVVVNRVATAIQVHKLASDLCGAANVHLVTGRMRPLDRDDLDRRISKLVGSARARDPDAPPVVVVATQCIEAGADFDFDFLVTECASLDALRQRFGRLNRLGTVSDSKGVVLVRSDALGKDASDPVYGSALARTWEWLRAASRDFGIQAMDGALAKETDGLDPMLPEKSRAPVMLPAHLDAWAQTTPVPRPDPEISYWLHGVDHELEADVQIVWRADVGEEDLSYVAAQIPGRAADTALDALLGRIDACPPTGLEALSVPIGAAKAWLANVRSGGSSIEMPDVSDVDRVARENRDERREGSPGRAVLLWKGDDSAVIQGKGITPGMTLIVPSSYGGLASGTWDPSSTTPVPDIAERGRWQQTGRPMLRLHRSLLEQGWSESLVPQTDEDPQEACDRIEAWLTAFQKQSLPDWLSALIVRLRRDFRRSSLLRLDAVVPTASGSRAVEYFALVGRGGSSGDASTEDEGSSYTGVQIPLHSHMKGVRTWAGRFASRCGLSPSLVRDVELAARWHDAGKTDPRFQRWLHGGSPLADVAPEPLAKSRIVMADRRARMRARERSGYPRGARHELSSVAIMENEATVLAGAGDRDLVLHLIASHHGWCRPFAPVVEDREPVDLMLDIGKTTVTVPSDHGLEALHSGIADRYWLLTERYGWFGLAWLEAIIRLADHRRSEQEQEPDFVEEVEEA
jgi:CRISPR-associated endonuclease/helicase Cas3